MRVGGEGLREDPLKIKAWGRGGGGGRSFEDKRTERGPIENNREGKRLLFENKRGREKVLSSEQD